MRPWRGLREELVCVEIGWRTLRVLQGGAVREWPLERTPTGRLTEACRTTLQSELKGALRSGSWVVRRRVVCGIDGRGVTLRRMNLPRTARDAMRQVLALQMEAEFPLPPDKVAWGYVRLDETGGGGGGASGQECLIAAVRRELIDEYTELLTGGDGEAEFTLSALARHRLRPPGSGTGAMLELGSEDSELLLENGHGPTRLRVLPWGERSWLEALEGRTGLSAGEVAALWGRFVAGNLTGSDRVEEVREAMSTAVESLKRHLEGVEVGSRLWVTGRTADHPRSFELFADRLRDRIECVSLTADLDKVRGSASLRGLERVAMESDRPMIRLESASAESRARVSAKSVWRWAALAACLLVGWLVLPYVEASWMRPRLAGRLAALKQDQGRLGLIDREFEFLRYLKQNQPPYLEAVYLISQAVPPGSRMESLSMNRRGELVLRGMLGMPQQVADFRSKLLDSGFFAAVVVEEQTPTPDRQKVNVRVSALWKPASARENLEVFSTNAVPAVDASGSGAPRPSKP